MTPTARNYHLLASLVVVVAVVGVVVIILLVVVVDLSCRTVGVWCPKHHDHRLVSVIRRDSVYRLGPYLSKTLQQYCFNRGTAIHNYHLLSSLHTHTHTRARTDTHAHTHTYTHTHTHTNKHTNSGRRL